MGKLKNDMAKNLIELDNLLSVKLPDKIQSEAQKLVSDSFQNEQYPGKSKWQGRKGDSDGGKSRDSRGGLLFKSGDLNRSVDAEQEGVRIVIGTDSEYAQIHNEGLEGNAFGKHKFQMPQRQFMPAPGEDMPAEFDDKVQNYLDDQMDKIFK